MRVALFVTCLVDAWTPQVGRAVIKLLERLGVTADVPLEQSCCGQMHVNTGYPDLAVPLVRKHVRAFAGYDAIVVPSGSCAPSVRHQHAGLAAAAADTRLQRQAADVASRTMSCPSSSSMSWASATSGPTSRIASPTTRSVTRCGSCAWATARFGCCGQLRGSTCWSCWTLASAAGSGGTFAVKNTATSAAMLADKTTSIRVTGADFCAATDASCLLHIGGGLSRLHTGVRTRHIAEILASTR